MFNIQDKIVHYIHLNKLWYYWIDEYEYKKYWRKSENHYKDINLLTNEIITERQCKNLLRNLFPKNKIIKAFPYHHSPSPFGSRPKKFTIDRKRMQKEKISFKKELESYIK